MRERGSRRAAGRIGRSPVLECGACRDGTACGRKRSDLAPESVELGSESQRRGSNRSRARLPLPSLIAPSSSAFAYTVARLTPRIRASVAASTRTGSPTRRLSASSSAFKRSATRSAMASISSGLIPTTCLWREGPESTTRLLPASDFSARPPARVSPCPSPCDEPFAAPLTPLSPGRQPCRQPSNDHSHSCTWVHV